MATTKFDTGDAVYVLHDCTIYRATIETIEVKHGKPRYWLIAAVRLPIMDEDYLGLSAEEACEQYRKVEYARVDARIDAGKSRSVRGLR